MKSNGKGKKRATESFVMVDKNSNKEDSSSSNDDDAELSSDSSNEEEVNNQDIDVEFEAFPPTEGDFHGIRNLLLKVFLTLHADISGLTDLLISQSNIGSTIKIVDDEEDETYGIVSILSLTKFQDKTCVKDLKAELLSKVKENASGNFKKFDIYLKEKNIGLIFNERFINIPPQIAGPFHKSLRDEVEKAGSEDPLYKFDYLMLISKTLKPTANPSCSTSACESTKVKKKKLKHIASEEEIEYTNFEEEVFQKASELSFSYEVTKATGLAVGGDWDLNDRPMKTFRTVMLVPTAKWEKIVNEIEDIK